MSVTTNPPYEQGRVAVDPVIFTIKDEKLWVYLNTREIAPFKGLAELPGGLLFSQETAEETLARKLAEVVPVQNVFFKQFYTFTDPKRDPRVRTVSIGFIALVAETHISQTDHFYELASLPKLAFDHQDIIEKAFSYLQQNLDHHFARQFLPVKFPLNQLQMVYEVISGEKSDNRNFRKKMLDSGLIKKVDGLHQQGAHRPAALFAFV